MTRAILLAFLPMTATFVATPTCYFPSMRDAVATVVAPMTRCGRSGPCVFLPFVVREQQQQQYCTALYSKRQDDKEDDEGASLAAEFFKMAQQKGVELEAEDIADEDEEEADELGEEDGDDEEDEEEEMNIPQGAINVFLGYDTGNVGEKLAGNVSLTNDQLYSGLKERVLDTAGGFVEFVKGARDDDEDGSEDDEDELMPVGQKVYEPPTTVPDSDLTAGEVVILVLDALLHNDVPSKNRGVEILFGYSSDGSSIKNEVDLTPSEYCDFLKETEYKILFNHKGVSIDKADYSFDGKKAFFTARLQVGDEPLDFVSVNFILSTKGVDDDACWLIDSMLIRPQSMRRRRRK
jgi:hypothetical protein